MESKLKYSTEISEIACDLTLFKEYDSRTAYRWVFESIYDVRNFIPVYTNPNRGRTDCRGWALSFFEEHLQARQRITRLAENKPKIYNKLGTHIALGILGVNDGMSDDANGDGHFNHFEYINVNLENKFTVIESLL
ncbi:hypothetical protein [uncultured Chitinophaga sp.]|uniref:hypothetical protein n=1 Tax=uncultured Chitinophaga sp. TaxID=339340 RepID=UPI0025DC1503|nr:hypothetical protein [uncultured Chitinophaga sp.]